MSFPAPESAELKQAPKAQLLRILGVGFGVAVIFGGTIGVGILRLPGTVAAQLDNYWLILAIWVIGGIYALLGSISVTELGAMLPQAGGFYVYARRAFGGFAGFAVGWGDWLNNCAVLAYASVAAAGYLIAVMPDLAGRDKTVALAVLACFAVPQWMGLRLTCRGHSAPGAIPGLRRSCWRALDCSSSGPRRMIRCMLWMRLRCWQPVAQPTG